MSRRIPREHPALDGLAKTHKTCNTCGEIKPLADFPRNKLSSDGFQGWCKICKQTRQRERYTSEEARKRMLRKYGLTPESYAVMLEAQGGGCAICGATEVGVNFTYARGATSSLHVDHDHAAGHVRGILCHNCNLGLGRFKDDPDRLDKAAQYLRKTSGP